MFSLANGAQGSRHEGEAQTSSEKLPKAIAWAPGAHIIDRESERLSASGQSLAVLVFLVVV